MHPARSFHEADPDLLTRLVEARGFALVVAVADGRPVSAAAPVMLAGSELRFHLSARSRCGEALKAGSKALVVVSLDDAYISPDWYAAQGQVPTWNYRAVEIEGPVRVLSDSETTALLDDLSARHEARLAPKAPWTRAKMAPGAFEAMLGGITGFSLTITRLEGTLKLSQNKSSEIERVAAQLEGGDEPARSVAAAMRAVSVTPPS